MNARAYTVATRRIVTPRWHYPDEPMRCATGAIGGLGECLHCNAEQGEVGRCCRDAARKADNVATLA